MLANRLVVTLLGFGLIAISIGTAKAQTIETETTRLLAAGHWKIGGAGESQLSSEGKEFAVPLLIEYGLRDNLEWTIEPVAVTAIRPKSGTTATGVGDLESTFTWRFHEESARSPALAVALEAKVPTANNELIGSGKTDFAGYLIASRRIGRVDLHANISYTLIGKPTGADVQNVFGAAIAGVFHVNDDWQLFAELYGNTSALAGGEAPDAPVLRAPAEPTGVTSEIGASEVVLSAGAGRYVRRDLLLFGSIGYDNNNATQLRLGFTWKF